MGIEVLAGGRDWRRDRKRNIQANVKGWVVGVMRAGVGMGGLKERALGRVVTQSRGHIAVEVGGVSMRCVW